MMIGLQAMEWSPGLDKGQSEDGKATERWTELLYLISPHGGEFGAYAAALSIWLQPRTCVPFAVHLLSK